MKSDDYFLKRNTVPPRSFKKSDLLKLYNNSGTAYYDRNVFNDLIQKSYREEDGERKYLKEELNKLSYNKRNHFVTIPQCEVIFLFLGSPILCEKNLKLLIEKGLISYEQLQKNNILYK